MDGVRIEAVYIMATPDIRLTGYWPDEEQTVSH
jgi:hypothetical protein